MGAACELDTQGCVVVTINPSDRPGLWVVCQTCCAIQRVDAVRLAQGCRAPFGSFNMKQRQPQCSGTVVVVNQDLAYVSWMLGGWNALVAYIQSVHPWALDSAAELTRQRQAEVAEKTRKANE